jgi:hypothetical protein
VSKVKRSEGIRRSCRIPSFALVGFNKRNCARRVNVARLLFARASLVVSEADTSRF